MKYVVHSAAAVLLAAMVFSSCTCHRQVDSPTGSAPAGFKVEIGPTMTLPAVASTPTAGETPTAAVTAAAPTAATRPSPTPPDHLPTDFPSEVPVIPGSTLAQVQDMANSARNVIFTSEKPVPELVQTYQEKMTKQGWRITQQFTRDKHAFATYEKGGMLVNVTIVNDVDAPGQQVIAVMYEEQKPLEFDDFSGDE